MKYCRYCGCPLEDDAVLCTKCGTVVNNLPQTTQRQRKRPPQNNNSGRPAQSRKQRPVPKLRVSQQTTDNQDKPRQRKPRENSVQQETTPKPRQRKPRENSVQQETTPKPRQRKPRENSVQQETSPNPRQRRPRESQNQQEQPPRQRKSRRKAPPERQREQEEIIQEPVQETAENAQPFIAPLPKLPKFIRVLFKIMFVVVAVCGLLLGGLSSMHVYTARLATPKLEDVEQTECYAAGFSEYFEDGEWEYSFIKNRVVYKAEIDNKHYEFVFKVKIFRSANVTRITQDKKPLDQNKQSILLYDIFT